MYAIEIENLSKAFKNKFAVKSLNMHIEQGAIYGFIGENGAGKTTTQRMVCGLLNPNEGKIKLFGKPVSDEEIRSKIGVIIESPALFGYLDAYQNMLMQALNIGVENPHDEIVKNLNIVGLKDVGNKKAKDFSLGMRQRLAIAEAMLGKPRILVLDEPTNGLDPEGIIEIRNILLKINKEEKVTILISSHILGELSKIATHYGIIKGGSMVEEISAEELKKRCKDCLCVKTNNQKLAFEVLNKAIDKKYSVENGKDEIRIYSFEDGYAVNKILIDNDVIASEISFHRMDLEEYFLNLMGGMKND